MAPIILIDCHNVGHAAFYALGQLDFHGRRTGVIYGFLLRIFSIAKKFDTIKFIFCWDSKQSIRRAHFKGYKDRNKKNKEIKTESELLDLKALHNQLDEIRDNTLPLMGFSNNLYRNGFEADDIIAAVIRNGEFPTGWKNKKEPEFIIVSSDKDLYQLLGRYVCIYNLRAGTVYTIKKFREEYRIEPQDWVMAKAIGGCVSDTIPGIEGIADPAKSKDSRAVKYLRGELGGKWADLINSDEGRIIIDRNLPLVELPIKPISPVIQNDHFTKESFLDIFDQYGFESFLRKEKLREILNQFSL